MARKSINLTADKPSKEELLRRATGKSLPPGVTGTPPLAAGRAYVPTPQARDAMANVGFDPAALVEAEPTAPLPLPPALSVPFQAPAAAVPAATAEEAARTAAQTQVPGLSDAIKIATQAATQAPMPEIVPPPDKPSETGANLKPATCPHCLWDLAQTEGITAPTEIDKASFVHSILGNKVWVKTVSLFGGALEVTYRTLTSAEVDTCFKQVYSDWKAGNIKDMTSYYEQVNRYRLVLQLLEYRTAPRDGAPGMTEQLPDGYSAETNPGAEAFWEGTPTEGAVTNLPDIEKHVTTKLLTTETHFRAVSSACHQFNRLAARLEAMADNSDFWQPTKSPS